MGLFVVVSLQGGEAQAKLDNLANRPGSALLLGAFSIVAPILLIAIGDG